MGSEAISWKRCRRWATGRNAEDWSSLWLGTITFKPNYSQMIRQITRLIWQSSPFKTHTGTQIMTKSVPANQECQIQTKMNLMTKLKCVSSTCVDISFWILSYVGISSITALTFGATSSHKCLPHHLLSQDKASNSQKIK